MRVSFIVFFIVLRNVKLTHSVNDLYQSICNLFINHSFNFRASDSFQRRKDRLVNLSLDRLLDHSSRVPRQLTRDELQYLFLTIKFLGLLMQPSFFKALI